MKADNMYIADNNDRRYFPVVHKKTGNIYFVTGYAIDCTNAHHDADMVIYVNQGGMNFVREEDEFWQKFEAFSNYEGCRVMKDHNGNMHVEPVYEESAVTD